MSLIRFYAVQRLHLVAYLFFVVLVLLGFYYMEKQDDKINQIVNDRTEERNVEANTACLESKQTRDVLRGQVSAVATLGISFVDTDPDLVLRFKEFERVELEKLPPIECKPIS